MPVFGTWHFFACTSLSSVFPAATAGGRFTGWRGGAGRAGPDGGWPPGFSGGLSIRRPASTAGSTKRRHDGETAGVDHERNHTKSQTILPRQVRQARFLFLWIYYIQSGWRININTHLFPFSLGGCLYHPSTTSPPCPCPVQHVPWCCVWGTDCWTSIRCWVFLCSSWPGRAWQRGSTTSSTRM